MTPQEMKQLAELLQNVPGIRSIELIMRHLAEAVLVGSQSAAALKQKGEKPAAQPELAAAGEAKDGNV